MFKLQEVLGADLHSLSIHGHISVRVFVEFLLDAIERNLYLTPIFPIPREMAIL